MHCTTSWILNEIERFDVSRKAFLSFIGFIKHSKSKKNPNSNSFLPIDENFIT
jgi:hypothetical protein